MTDLTDAEVDEAIVQPVMDLLRALVAGGRSNRQAIADVRRVPHRIETEEGE